MCIALLFESWLLFAPLILLHFFKSVLKSYSSFFITFRFHILTYIDIESPVPLAARCKAQVCGRSPAEIVSLNPTGAWIFVCCECCVLSCRGLCDKLITCPEESYRLWSVVVCDLGNLNNEEAMTRVGSQRHSKKKDTELHILIIYVWINVVI